MTIAYRLNGALLPFESVRFNPDADAAFPSAAWYCEPMVAGVIIEDQSGSLDLTGWSTFTVEETACSKPRIFTGWIAGKEISRGRDSNRAGTARVWNCDIVDQNALFSFEVFRSTAASVRPAETDVARIQAMIASHAMAGTPIYDNGRLETSGAVNLSSANFVTQFPAEMAVSTAGSCTKNVYAYWDDTADQISIHYDAIGVGPAATISFSNVSTDVNGTTVFAPLRDAVLSQDPYSLYTGFLMGWVGGYTYLRNQDLIDDLSPTEFSPINFLRDQFYSTSRIGRSSTAAAYTARYLAEAGVEKVTLRFSAILPASVVNLAHAGDVVTVKFSHLPGFTSNTAVSIIRRSVRPVDDHDSLYEVSFECASFAGAAPGGGGGGTLPHPRPCDEDNITLVDTWMDTAPGAGDTVDVTFGPVTAGNLLVLNTTYRGLATAVTIDGWNLSPLETTQRNFGGDTSSNAIYTRIADGTETHVQTEWSSIAEETRGHVSEWTGLSGEVIDYGFGSTDGSLLMLGGEVTIPSGSVVLVYTAIAYNEGGDIWPYPDPIWNSPAVLVDFNKAEGENHPVQLIGYQVTTGTGATIQHSALADFVNNGDESSNGQTLVFVCESGNIPPLPGQPVNAETPSGTVDGSNDDFGTQFPYAPGSLRVTLDGIDVTDEVTEADPAAGEFTLSFAPLPAKGDVPAEELHVYYQGHP